MLLDLLIISRHLASLPLCSKQPTPSDEARTHGEEVATRLAEVKNRDQLLVELRAAETRAAGFMIVAQTVRVWVRGRRGSTSAV